ncbi:AAA family ATPase [Arcobacteraceae bacterium]|nr:AAA family ATPase [Arcobacteraceae bacterium]
MKLKVENLAKIKEAEVEIKNLTLFIGQNSTNKSYMAHIIYELYKELSLFQESRNAYRFNTMIAKKLMSEHKKEVEYFFSLKHEFEEVISSNQIAFDEWEDERTTNLKIYINEDDQKIINFSNSILDIIFSDLTDKINNSFNINKSILKKLYVIDYISKIANNNFLISLQMPIEEYTEIDYETKFRGIIQLVKQLTEKLQEQLNNYFDSYYFPASRTGFVLTLDEIYAGIFRDKFRGQVSATRLGEPTIDFIQTFADIKMGKFDFDDWFNPIETKKESDELVKFLEKEIIKGNIQEETNKENYTSYYLKIKNEKLDLHLASSATLETLPFIIFLKNTKNIKRTLFVIEEPEAHLHPKAQIQMARFIVMLTNAGAKVLVTTHSDYILGEINNCIKKFELKEENISISKDNVSAYLFKNNEIETEVKELQIDQFGISDENFEEALNELLDESGRLTDKILDNE